MGGLGGTLSRRVAFDKQALTMYYFLDMSLARHSSASEVEEADLEDVTLKTFTVSPSRVGGKPWEVEYTDLPGTLVCEANFGIDSFSDSFCLRAACVRSSTCEMLALDAR